MKHSQLVNKILYNRFLYKTYYFAGNIAISFLKLFIKNDNKTIIFVSFGGKKFDDSPKAIYDEILSDTRYDDYRLVWAFMNPDGFTIPRGDKIRIDTLRYFITALKSRVWITNSSITRGLSFKGDHTFYYNSWHGTALKKMGTDLPVETESFQIKKKRVLVDMMSAQGDYDVSIFSRVFQTPKSIFKITGLPRNDGLVCGNNEINKNEIRERLSIPAEKKVILYAPTFREYSRDEDDDCVIAPPVDFDKWNVELGEKYILLFRAHYDIIKVLNVKESSFVKNVSDYPCLNDLMLISDVLITDYSSVCFDYSILCRPILWFCFDYDMYCTKRGVYFDVRDYFPNCFFETEDLLIEGLKTLDYKTGSEYCKSFRDSYVTEYGTATKQVVDILYKEIQK